VLSRPINWDLIAQQYDQMIRYATALRLGTADTEAILRRFTRTNLAHPTYRALAELGKAVKTVFLCEYLGSEQLRREVHEGLNVIESWNGVNGFIYFGKGGEIITNRHEDQELAVLCLLLDDPASGIRLTPDDLRGLTPLTYSHVNPHGTFRLDMTERLPLAA
jgi:TnpA family transposase